MSILKEVTEKLAAKGKLISQAYAEAGESLDFSKVKCLTGNTTQEKLDALKAIDQEVTDLHKERQELLAHEAAKKRADGIDTEFNKPAGKGMTFPGEGDEGGNTGSPAAIKGLGQLFVESKAAELKHTKQTVDVEVKTLFQTSAGWDPEATRISRVELYPLRKLEVVDYIPMFNTGADTIKYMKETTFTNNAAEAAAGGTYGEAALAYTETSDEVEKIGVWLPVTDEQLEDVPGMESLLNQRLTYMLKARLGSQCLNGDGSTPNLLGTANLSSVQTQAKGADPTPDAIYKAMTAIRVTGFAEPSVVYIHPNDWQEIRLLRTADGIYIFGSPQDPGIDRIWGVPVCATTARTEATAIVGDYQQYSALYMRRGVQFQVTNAHDDFFIKGKQAIRCDVRCSMVHFRDTAFCTVTSI